MKVVSWVSCGIMAIVICFVAPLFKRLPMVILKIPHNNKNVLLKMYPFLCVALKKKQKGVSSVDHHCRY